MRSFLFLALPLAIIFGIWFMRGRRARLAPQRALMLDAAGVAALGAARNVTQPADVEFYLYLPSEERARAAAVDAEREGYGAEVQPPLPSSLAAGDATWLCLLSRRMAPTQPAVAAARERLEALASVHGGNFDGWEAAVE